MLVDDQLPEHDVCIVGSGPGATALADRLATHGRRVLVVESGPMQPAAWADALNAGDDPEGIGFRFQSGRHRGVGGAGTLWWGQCVRLEDSDLTARGWIPHSGWPIGAADLADHYDAAEEWYRVAGLPDTADLDRRLPDPPAFAGAPDFAKVATVFTRRKDHTERLVQLCRRSASVHLLHSATVTELSAAEGRVTAVTIRTPGGRARVVPVRNVVLAAGGVDNARLLLLADRALGGGSVFNPHDLVGRFLQEHPSYFPARVTDPAGVRIQREFGLRYWRRYRFWPKLALSAATQEQAGVPGATVALVTRFGPGSGVEALKALVGDARRRQLPAGVGRLLADVVRDGRVLLPELPARMRGFAPAHAIRASTLVQVQFEQAPDPTNRVRLSERRDTFGVPLPLVELRIGPMERRALQVIVERLDRELRERGLGRLDDDLAGLVEDREQWAMAAHHAGTTRMSSSPRSGVVDRNCRVHDIANLHVVGGSVFPTSGWANPTLTIVALAFRLGDELDRRLDALPAPQQALTAPA